MAIPDATRDAPAGPADLPELIRRHAGEAFAFALRLTRDPAEAEDLAQEGLVSAFRAFGSFRGESSFRTWLYQILINRHRDRIRVRQREDRDRNALKARTTSEETAPAAGGESTGELEAEIRRRIDGLPPRQREVLLLHTYQGLDYRMIAGVLGCTYEDVKVNLSLARKRLREELKGYL